MGKRKALLIGPLPPPIGGDTVSTLNLLSSRYWGECGIDVIHINTAGMSRVRLPTEGITPRDLFRGFRILVQFLWKLPRAGVVLLWANSRFVCTLGLSIILVSILMRKPVIVKVFGAFLAERIRRLHRPWRTLTIYMLRKARYVLPETKRLTGELEEEIGLSASRVVIFPSFFPDSAFHGDFAKKSFSGNCVFVGQVKREKGVFDIIEALGDKDGYRCDFYGQIAERDRDSFMKEISSYDNLNYHGVLRPEEVHSLIGGYDVLLLPTYHPGEGYPAIILETFAAGVPVIASDWLSIPDLVLDGVRGVLVPIKSPGSIEQALGRLESDSEFYESMARNSFEYAKSFSEKKVVRDILVERVIELFG
ncbi:MAG: glycosyltransferase [Candidatus Krumholzibacteria bacterium]|nr:glycosyltransferase [Candidatus Krumholzibacteria bacterium]